MDSVNILFVGQKKKQHTHKYEIQPRKIVGPFTNCISNIPKRMRTKNWIKIYIQNKQSWAWQLESLLLAMNVQRRLQCAFDISNYQIALVRAFLSLCYSKKKKTNKILTLSHISFQNVVHLLRDLIK